MTTLTNTEIATVLCKAVAIIEDKGWCQHKLQDPQGRVCAYGAVAKALDLPIERNVKLPSVSAEYYLVADYIEEYVRVHLGKPLGRWNDAPGRTKEDVVELLLKSISSLVDA